MNIKQVELKDIVFYKKNPRKNDGAVDAVAQSIKSYGFKVPVVLDAQNIVVCGHTRVKAAQRLGLTSVPCVIADDLTDAQIQAFRIADNRTHEFSEWDFELLRMEMIDLQTLDFDVSLTGFFGEELKNLFKSGGALNLEEDPTEKEKQGCRCPKCGFEFDVLRCSK